MNILLTGLPKSGKTTLIEKIIQKLNRPAFGFYTKEILENKKRVGFSLITLSGNKVILSHQNFKSNYRVGKYGVDVQGFEGMALPEIEKGIQEKGIIVIDEIGKMELFSRKFQGTVLKALDSPSLVLGTIIFTSHPFADKIKKRGDVEIFELTISNREEIFAKLFSKITTSLSLANLL